MTDDRVLIARLLGPSESELSCEACFDELDRYVELQLRGLDAEAAVPGMGAHLRGCPACSEEHASLTATSELRTTETQGHCNWSGCSYSIHAERTYSCRTLSGR